MPPKFQFVCPECREDVSKSAIRAYEGLSAKTHGMLHNLPVECPKCLKTTQYKLNWEITLASVQPA